MGVDAEGRELDAVGPAPWRRRVVAAAIVLALVAVFASSALMTDVFNAYPHKGRCRESNVAGAILDEGRPPEGLPALPSTAEAAIADYAPTAAWVDGRRPLPADGWQDYRGRWVHDWTDGRFLQLWIVETEQGWRVDGYTVC